MKITKQYLKQLILEEINEQEEQEQQQLSAQKIKKELMDLIKDLSGIQMNEMDLVQTLIDIIKKAKEANINTSELRRTLGITKKAAEKTKKWANETNNGKLSNSKRSKRFSRRIQGRRNGWNV